MIFESIVKCLRFTILASIAFLTLEILLRRWYWAQLPTQLPAGMVYLLLVGNFWFLWSSLRR